MPRLRFVLLFEVKSRLSRRTALSFAAAGCPIFRAAPHV